VTVYVQQDLVVKLTAVNEAGTAANPSGVRFKVKDPAGTSTTYTLGVDSELTEVTSGKVYHLTLDMDTAGAWRFRGETLNGSGSVVGVSELTVIVEQSSVV